MPLITLIRKKRWLLSRLFLIQITQLTALQQLDLKAQAQEAVSAGQSLSAETQAVALDAAALDARSLDAQALGRLIWAQNPEIEQARLGLAQNRADLLRASLWQNPTLQAGAGSIPLSRKMLNTPHYPNPILDPLVGPSVSVSISQPVELGKREVRVQRYRQSLSVAEKAVELLYYQRLADLEEVLVRLALSRLRQEQMAAQLVTLKTLLENVRLSVEKGFSPPLDGERLALELGRMQVDSDAETLTLQNLRSQWSRLTLTTAPILTQADAQALMLRWCQAPERWPTQFNLPQQAVMASQQTEGELDLELAKRMAWPDPSFEMGYAYDSLPTGNVMHTLNTSVLIPLTIWQYGQADAQAAQGQLEELKYQQRALNTHLKFQEPAQRQLILTLQKNIHDLESQRLVLARATLERYQQALKAGGITLGDLIQTQRTVLDLESERLDLLQQLGLALVDYRRLTNWNLPKPEGATP